MGRGERPFEESRLCVQKRLNMGTKEMENLIETLPEEPRTRVRSTYDKIIEKGRREGREEGRREGREEGRREGREEGVQIGMERLLKRLIRNTTMSDGEIARMADVEIAYVAELRKRLREDE